MGAARPHTPRQRDTIPLDSRKRYFGRTGSRYSLLSRLPLRESGYDDIDKPERDMIARYRAYESGYNKTAGNK